MAALDGARSKKFYEQQGKLPLGLYAIRLRTVKWREERGTHSKERREREKERKSDSDFIPRVAEKRALFSFRATGIESKIERPSTERFRAFQRNLFTSSSGVSASLGSFTTRFEWVKETESLKSRQADSLSLSLSLSPSFSLSIDLKRCS